MPLTLQRPTIAEIVRLALMGRDHRAVVGTLIDEMFVADVLDFFGKVVDAKINDTVITRDWYEREFMSNDLSSSELAWNAGTTLKTIKNSRGTARRAIVIEEALTHHRRFLELINEFDDGQVGVTLGLTFRSVTVELDLSETFIVINALAVRRSGLRGGAWSTAGKQVEGPLMEVLCALHDVNPSRYRRMSIDDAPLREVDFYLVDSDGREAKCEVKLMGSGNPESADTFIARESKVFVASNLSDLNKQQFNDMGVLWTELQSANGFVRFGKTLAQLGIPHRPLHPTGDHSRTIARAVSAYLGSER